MTRKTPVVTRKPAALPAGYAGIHGGIVELLDAARQAAARSVNTLMTASYWEIGRRIVEAEQKGRRRAGYGEQLMERLSADLTARFGRGFGVNNLESMRRFFLAYPPPEISQTLSGKLGNESPTEKSQTVSRKFDLSELAQVFTLPWSAYVRLLSVKDDHARQFYETEALRGGWSVRQLDRQPVLRTHGLVQGQGGDAGQGFGGQARGCRHAQRRHQRPVCAGAPRPQGRVLGIRLGSGLDPAAGRLLAGTGGRLHLRRAAAPVAYRPDLVSGRSAVLPSQAALLGHHRPEAGQLDPCRYVGQMHMYCNYAKEHWAYPDENPPVGLILCADKGHALARYALDGLPTKVMAANYRTVLPDAELLQKELENTRRLLESRGKLSLKDDKP